MAEGACWGTLSRRLFFFSRERKREIKGTASTLVLAIYQRAAQRIERAVGVSSFRPEPALLGKFKAI